MRRRQAGPIASLVLGVIFAGAGIATCYFSKPTLDDAKASADWPNVQGKVTRSKVIGRKNSKGKRNYSAAIDYQYEVDGKKYSGDTVWFGQSTSRRKTSAQKLVAQFPSGQKVDVYYDPEVPGVSVLLPGAFLSSYLVFGVGVLFAVIGSLAVLTVALKGFLAGMVCHDKAWINHHPISDVAPMSQVHRA